MRGPQLGKGGEIPETPLCETGNARAVRERQGGVLPRNTREARQLPALEAKAGMFELNREEWLGWDQVEMQDWQQEKGAGLGVRRRPVWREGSRPWGPEER